MDGGSAAHRHSASKTRVNALMGAAQHPGNAVGAPYHATSAFDMPHHSGNEQGISGQGLFRVSMARYDVVVIGAGLGGLTAGAILAPRGTQGCLSSSAATRLAARRRATSPATCSSRARCIKPAIRTIPRSETSRADARRRHRRGQMDPGRRVLRSARRSAQPTILASGQFRCGAARPVGALPGSPCRGAINCWKKWSA